MVLYDSVATGSRTDGGTLRVCILGQDTASDVDYLELSQFEYIECIL